MKRKHRVVAYIDCGLRKCWIVEGLKARQVIEKACQALGFTVETAMALAKGEERELADIVDSDNDNSITEGQTREDVESWIRFNYGHNKARVEAMKKQVALFFDEYRDSIELREDVELRRH